QGMNVYVDLRRRDAGPELMVEAGLWQRADHVVTRARGWRRAGMIECDSTMTRDTEADVVVLRLTGDCLPERHARARVAVLTYESSDDGVESDWQTARRTFGPWVARGAA
ncbi:hypothetical protein, partial [Acinetobacter nosocomialis]|uniref:hypothetical protein n=1 Tax=Acinetobacter nosocomialis TaxID=106654 RepID=UPI00148F346E